MVSKNSHTNKKKAHTTGPWVEIRQIKWSKTNEKQSSVLNSPISQDKKRCVAPEELSKVKALFELFDQPYCKGPLPWSQAAQCQQAVHLPVWGTKGVREKKTEAGKEGERLTDSVVKARDWWPKRNTQIATLSQTEWGCKDGADF